MMLANKEVLLIQYLSKSSNLNLFLGLPEKIDILLFVIVIICINTNISWACIDKQIFFYKFELISSIKHIRWLTWMETCRVCANHTFDRPGI